MNLDADNCYRALSARDTRFDGLFFVGVRTTAIYCRPVCPARTPRRTSCTFFANAAAAERDGYRPCLRCRPELAPGLAPVDATARVADAAARAIAAGALNDGSLEDLAGRFAVSSRQLRRVVQDRLGVSPIELAQTHRLLLAKQLLTDTSLSITEVAYAAGFASLRRFNALWRERYNLTPSDLRRTRPSESSSVSQFSLKLNYRAPMAWRELVSFLGARSLAGVEHVDGDRYARTVAIGECRGWIEVGPSSDRRDALEVALSPTLVPVLPQVLARVRHLFDLDARPDVIATHLRSDPRLAPLIKRTPGLRVPGAFTGFEMALRAIVGQQVSVKAARTVAGRLMQTYGEALPGRADASSACATRSLPQGHALTHASPSPDRIAGATVSQLCKHGLNGARAESLRTLARAAADDPHLLEPGCDAEVAQERFQELPGIGAWTAAYIAMRALHWPDAFPWGDLGLKKALDLERLREVREAGESWRPWRAYAAMYLWHSLSAGG